MEEHEVFPYDAFIKIFFIIKASTSTKFVFNYIKLLAFELANGITAYINYQ